ncbi:MAG: electron transport complex subunit RsxE [Bacillota bacterium]
MSRMAIFTNGLIKENPIFVFLLGMCPSLAVTSSVETSLGMGLLVIFVLTMSNIVVSLIKNLIPDEIRVPSYIVIIATFVTIVEMVTEAFAPALFEALGIFIPLIVVNCLILGRAESFASKNSVFDSALDGLGMALGFTFALILIGFTREVLATGAIAYGVYLPLGFEGSVMNIDSHLLGMEVFTGPAGGFIVIGLWLAIFQAKGNYDAFKKAENRRRFIEEKKREAAEKKRKKKAMEKAGEAS